MAEFDLTSLLGVPALMGSIEARTISVPNPFPPSFFKKDPEDEVVKDYGTFYRYYGQRKTAPLNTYGGRSRTVQQQNLEGVPVKLLSTSINIEIPMSKMRGLMRKDSTGQRILIDEKGADFIKRQVQNQAALLMNLRIATMAYALSTDAIYFDGGGNLLPSAAGSLFSVKSGVPAGNQGQGVFPGSSPATAIITKSWDDPATQIQSQLEVLNQAASVATGFKPKLAFYGNNVLNYLVTNTTLKSYFQFNIAANTQFIGTNKIPQTFGYNWSYAGEAQWDASTSVAPNSLSTNLIWGNDLCVFTPDPEETPGWISFLEGEMDVPTDIGHVGSDGLDILGSVKTVTGMWAYAVINHDPLAIKIIMGDTFLPVIKVPSAVWQLTTLISGC
jgi:hypothetical protein